jgi:hypothetical protein
MVCSACGTELEIDTKFCPQCGTIVAQTAVGTPVSHGRTGFSMDIAKLIGWLAISAISLLVVILIVKGSTSPDKNDAQNAPLPPQTGSWPANDVTASPPIAPDPQSPPPSGLTLHPYELLKNPYQADGKLITLRLNSMPVLFNGNVIQYSDPVDPAFGVRMGLMALRLDRMVNESTALYDIMGIEAGSSTGQTLGQIAVELPDGQTVLKLDQAWMVEPVKPLQGTNYMGAPIQIPSVHFWRYAGEPNHPATNQQALVAQGMGFRYTKYPNGYMVDELCSAKVNGSCYPFNWQPWLKSLERNTAASQTEALNSDSGVADSGNLVVSWDSEQRVVFFGCRAHECPSAYAYFIVAPTKRELDIIWQRDDQVTYLGPNSAFLENAHAYEWLKQIGF